MTLAEIVSHKALWRGALIALGFYLALCLLVFLAQRRLIYLPSKGEWPLPPDFVEWRSPEGEFMGYKRVNRQPTCMFFFHGNGGNASGWAHAVAEFPGDVFVLEYPGYGRRPGQPAETPIKAAALQGFRAEHSRYSKAVVCGQSLGAAVTETIFKQHPEEVDLLVLVTPFVSLSEMARAQFAWLPARWLLRDRMELYEAWLRFGGRSVVVLAEQDEIIPRRQSVRYAEAKATNREVVQVNASHNTVDLDRAFWDRVLKAKPPAR